MWRSSRLTKIRIKRPNCRTTIAINNESERHRHPGRMSTRQGDENRQHRRRWKCTVLFFCFHHSCESENPSVTWSAVTPLTPMTGFVACIAAEGKWIRDSGNIRFMKSSLSMRRETGKNISHHQIDPIVASQMHPQCSHHDFSYYNLFSPPWDHESYQTIRNISI